MTSIQGSILIFCLALELHSRDCPASFYRHQLSKHLITTRPSSSFQMVTNNRAVSISPQVNVASVSVALCTPSLPPSVFSFLLPSLPPSFHPLLFFPPFLPLSFFLPPSLPPSRLPSSLFPSFLRSRSVLHDSVCVCQVELG